MRKGNKSGNALHLSFYRVLPLTRNLILLNENFPNPNIFNLLSRPWFSKFELANYSFLRAIRN